MSERLSLISKFPQHVQPAMAEPGPVQDLETLAQLVEQIDDALLVVEHPRLAARVFASLRSAKAA